MTVQRTPALDMALNSALSEREIIRSRQSMIGGGMDVGRPCAWASFGYKENLVFRDFYKLFERGGIAHGAVMTLTETCWNSDPEVIQGDEDDRAAAPTTWEKQFKQLAKRIKLWEKYRQADMYRLVGRFSCVLLQIQDSKRWDQPVGRASEKQLVDIIPAWGEGQMFVSEWNTDEMSVDFGTPKMWLYQEIAVQEDHEQPTVGRSLTVHPDRVVVLGDIRNGIPFLQAGYNDATNLEKVLGGSGESFLKNASRQLHIGYEKEVDLSSIAREAGVPMADLASVFDEAIRAINRGEDAGMITKGATVTPLVATVPDPTPSFEIALQSFCASIRIPSKIIIGNQQGQRASTEDQVTFHKRCQGRRVNTLSSDIETFVDHLMRLGMLTTLETSVVWDDLNESSKDEKMTVVQKMADINQKALASGEMIFTADEMRQVGGYEAVATIVPLPDVAPPADPAQPVQ